MKSLMCLLVMMSSLHVMAQTKTLDQDVLNRLERTKSEIVSADLLLGQSRGAIVILCPKCSLDIQSNLKSSASITHTLDFIVDPNEINSIQSNLILIDQGKYPNLQKLTDPTKVRGFARGYGVYILFEE